MDRKASLTATLMPTLEQIRLQLEHSLADLRMMEIAQRPAEKWAEVRKAWHEGKPVQVRAKEKGSDQWFEWEDLCCSRPPSWIDDDGVEYRIKPAPAWQPRFKVGDRVKLKHREDAAAIGEITELRTATRDYYVSHSGFAWNEDEIEPLPALPTERVALTDRERFDEWKKTHHQFKALWPINTPICESGLDDLQETVDGIAFCAWQAAATRAE